MERKIQIDLNGKTVNVFINENSDYGHYLKNAFKPCKVMIISDDNVFPLYGEKCVSELNNAGFVTASFVFKAGEQSKNIDTLGTILEAMAEEELTRKDIVVALGGGVTGDIAGLAASLYMRGIPVVQFPTSLLAGIDSSVGGKTAVDLKHGKNLMGAFHQPNLVVINTDTFKTLPDIYISDGYAEAIKYGMIYDKDLFEKLESKNISMGELCERCITIKGEVVAQDEFEGGLRKILNFGHTAGHAIESLSNYGIGHGMGVAVGMMIVCRGALKKGLVKEDFSERLENVLKSYSLPIESDFSPEEIAAKAVNDKKSTGKGVSVIITPEIGRADIVDMSFEEWTGLVKAGME